MRRFKEERRHFIDRIRLSEFLALICTGLMLLTLFLLSSTGDPVRFQGGTMNAGFPGKTILQKTPEKRPASIDSEDHPYKGMPSRGIDQFNRY